MAVDPKERLVYTLDRRGRPWWHGGRFVPARRRLLEGEPAARTTPRDVIWDLKVEGRQRIQVTFDLRTLRLYARLIERAE